MVSMLNFTNKFGSLWVSHSCDLVLRKSRHQIERESEREREMGTFGGVMISMLNFTNKFRSHWVSHSCGLVLRKSQHQRERERGREGERVRDFNLSLAGRLLVQSDSLIVLGKTVVLQIVTILCSTYFQLMY